MTESEKISIREPIVNDEENKSCCSKNLNKIILFTCLGIILIAAVVVILYFFVLKKDDEDEEHEEYEEYEYGLSLEELKNRTSKEYLGTKTLLKANAPEYESLEEGDKIALKHLVKAGTILENIELRIDDPHNLPFKKF